MARFLNFYPQYRLSDLRTMSLNEFYFLVAGMLDLSNPDETDPVEEVVQKRLKAMMAERTNPKQPPRRVRRR